MLGLSKLSLNLGSSRSGGGSVGAPQIYSTNTTVQGAVLTVSSGATLYRDGVAKTAPYTTTYLDALATFWAQVGTTKSSTIVIASSVATAPLYDGFQITCTKRNDGTATTGDFLTILDMDAKKANTSAFTGTYTTSTPLNTGVIGNLMDGNVFNQLAYSKVATVEICKFIFTGGQQALAGATFGFACSNIQGPGDLKIYGVVGTTPEASPLLTVTGVHDFSVNYLPRFTVPGVSARTIAGTFSYATALITLAIGGATGTTTVRTLEVSDPTYPVEYQDWTAKVDGGTISVPTQGAYMMLLNDSNDSAGTVASLAVNVMGQASVNATTGLNFMIMAPYYTADETRNLADKCAIYWSTGGITSDRTGVTGAPVVFDTYGNPIGPIPAGMTTLVYHIFESCPNLGRHGAHTATIINGAGTLRFANALNITTGSITSTTAAFTVPASGTGTIDLNIMVDLTSVPSDGLKLLVTKDSDGLTYPDHPLSPQAARDYEATQFGVRGVYLRDLHISNVESQTDPPADFGYKSRPEFAARVCNQTGANWAHSSHWTETDADRLDWVTRWKAAAPSTAILWGEYLNELWNNNPYSNQQSSVITLGINAGFMPAYQPGVGVTVYDGTSWTNPTSGVLNRSVAAGTVFWCFTFQSGQTPTSNGYYRWTLTKCLTGASSGDTVPFSGTNSQWQTIVSNDASGFFTAMYRYQATVQKRVGAMGHGLLGARFKSVLGATTNTSLESVATLTDAVTLDNNYEEIDYYALNGYVNDIAYNATTYPWMASPADTTAFANGFFAMIGPMVDAMVATMLARVDTQFASFIAAGIPANQCPRPAVYEFGMPRFSGIPDVDAAAWTTATNVVFADARMRTLVANWNTALLAKFDIIIWHNAVQAISVSGGAMQIYGALLRQEEITPPQTHEDFTAYAQAYLGILDAAPTV